MLTALAGVLGREWAIVVGGVAVCGWTLGVIALVLIIGRGGPVSKVADLPSRWTGLPADAEAAVFRWAVLEQMIQEEEVGDGMRALQQRTESEVDRKLAAGLVSEVAKVVPPSVTGVLSYQYGAWNAR
ncbi:hypothetical protein [Brevibacterium jeotgali]|uniref:Uncharacterized protein n=1 Tax=Brevibacterium jeotgali TaxID=1262550 RepID=A0A2H1L8N0_9MICO|nr:hypothetical protein [Brevibacterium jeotgali]TWC03259.1 hypothetical protein FB108_1982 [Brevibacterium jeotgali]SMY13232.1 hypothetical protein BJEO58_02844 [Brevibacterium jeotgali]